MKAKDFQKFMDDIDNSYKILAYTLQGRDLFESEYIEPCNAELFNTLGLEVIEKGATVYDEYAGPVCDYIVKIGDDYISIPYNLDSWDGGLAEIYQCIDVKPVEKLITVWEEI